MEGLFQDDKDGYKSGIVLIGSALLGEFMISMIITFFMLDVIPPDASPFVSDFIMWGTLILSYLAMLLASWGKLREFLTRIEDEAEAKYYRVAVKKVANHPILYMKAILKDEFWECNIHQDEIEGYHPEFKYRMGLPNGWGATSNDVAGMIIDGYVGIYRPYDYLSEGEYYD